jgi:hypothetical protein
VTKTTIKKFVSESPTHIWQPHNSSELNGTFKIKLYKTKQEYLRDMPQLLKKTPTDIIPIFNRCWQSTLGNDWFASKALFERGWSVLSYLLVDNPWLLCLEGDSSQLQSTSSNSTNTGSFNIDESSIVWQNTLDGIIKDLAKSDSCKRKYKEMHQLNAIKETNIQKLEKMMSILSGKLASNNIFCHDVSVRNKMS